MSDDVSQPPVLVPKARLVPSSRSSDLPQCQEVPWKQTVTDAHSHQSASPRIPASVKLPARSTQTPEARQEMAIAPANGSPGEAWAQRSCQGGASHENERERRRRHQQEDSTRHHSRDPEKAYSEQTSRSSNRHSPSRSYDRRIQYEIDDTGDGSTPEEHSVWILIYLSCLTPFLSVLFSIYTLVTTTTLLLLHPISYFCTEHVALSTQIRYFLLPPIAFQLGLIYSDIVVPKPEAAIQPSPSMLVFIDLCGPFYAVWIATSAWVAAAFWAFATIMGDPDGRDGLRGKDDGRAAVLGVRRWWEGWLERGIRC